MSVVNESYICTYRCHKMLLSQSNKTLPMCLLKFDKNLIRILQYNPMSYYNMKLGINVIAIGI